MSSSKQNDSIISEDTDYTKEVNNIFDNILPKAQGKSGIYDDNIYGVCAKCGEEVVYFYYIVNNMSNIYVASR